MTTNIFAFSDRGCILGKKIAEQYSGAVCYAPTKFAQKHGIFSIEGTAQKVKEIFDKTELIIFVGAVGIAVRMIAPCIKSKTTDPAVLAVDERGTFVIPVLSGHIGGANDTAKSLAHKLCAVAVITTATDINGKFSVDEWATKNGLHISSMQRAKEVSAAILTEDVMLKSDFPIEGALPNGVTLAQAKTSFDITFKRLENSALHLVPKVLSVGIGCKKDIPLQIVEALFLKTIKDNSLDINAVKNIASIDIKKDEKAIIALCQKYLLPFMTYTSEELESLAGNFTGSEFVKKTTGTDNVCERSAVIASGGQLIVKKTAQDGVTIAIAKKDWRVKF